jgi:hypothetical protein
MWDSQNYDDECELTHYVMAHCTDKFTDFERRVLSAVLARKKVARNDAEGGKLQSPLLKWARLDDPEINAALADGPEAFQRRVCQRIMANPLVAKAVHRCPRCQRVVRTPLARQCLWCGLDWHPRAPENA